MQARPAPGAQICASRLLTFTRSAGKRGSRRDILADPAWLADPARAIAAMVRAARPGGTIAVLDYDHTRAEWEPPMPPAVHHFYQAFQGWRADAGMDNAIAAHLQHMFEQAGLTDVTAVDQREVTIVRDADYQRRIALWPGVISTRGHQVVADGWLTEANVRSLKKTSGTGYRNLALPSHCFSVWWTAPNPSHPEVTGEATAVGQKIFHSMRTSGASLDEGSATLHPGVRVCREREAA